MSILLLGQHPLVFELADLLDVDGSDYVQLSDVAQLESIDCDGEIIVYPDLLYIIERGKTEPSDFQKLKQVCEFARENDSPLICLVSSRVFSATTSKVYAESSELDGDSALSLAFVEYENTVARLVKKHFLLRTSGVFTTMPGNYFSTLVDKLAEQQVLEIPRVSKCVFTASSDLARVVLAIIRQLECNVQEWGTYHYCSSDMSSFRDFADSVLSLASQYSDTVTARLVEVAEDAAPEFSQALTPRISCQKLRNTFGVQQRPWRSSLNDYIKGRFG